MAVPIIGAVLGDDEFPEGSNTQVPGLTPDGDPAHFLRKDDVGKMKTPTNQWEAATGNRLFCLLQRHPGPGAEVADSVSYKKFNTGVEEYVFPIAKSVNLGGGDGLPLKTTTMPEGGLPTTYIPALPGQHGISHPLVLPSNNRWVGYGAAGTTEGVYRFNPYPFATTGLNADANAWCGNNDARLISSLITFAYLNRTRPDIAVAAGAGPYSRVAGVGNTRILFRIPAAANVRAYLNAMAVNRHVNNIPHDEGPTWARIDNPLFTPQTHPLELVAVKILADETAGGSPRHNDSAAGQNIERAVQMNRRESPRLLWWRIFQACEYIFNRYAPDWAGGIADSMFVGRIVLQVTRLPAGGCSLGSNVRDVEIRGKMYKSIPSTHQNCLLACMNHSRKMNKQKKLVGQGLFETARSFADIPTNTPICPDDEFILNKLCEFFSVNMKIITPDERVLYRSAGKSFPTSATIVFHNRHFYIDCVRERKRQFCSLCGRVYYYEHKCRNRNRRLYYEAHGNGQKEKGLYEEFNPDSELQTLFEVYREEERIFFDLETFQDENREHIPYACGYWIQGEYRADYGADCLDHFIFTLCELEPNLIETEKNGRQHYCYKPYVVLAWNGSKYDFKILLSYIVKRCSEAALFVEIEDVIMTNNRLLTFGLKKKGETKIFVKFIDAVSFIPSSLDSACKNFIPSFDNKKTLFPHKLIRGFDDVFSVVPVELYNDPEYYFTDREKKEILEHPLETDDGFVDIETVSRDYLQRDVLAMKEVIDRFFVLVREELNINPESFVTLSQMSCSIWYQQCPYKHELYMCENMSEYEFIRQAVYGGRCYPTKHRFVSSDINFADYDGEFPNYFFPLQEMEKWKHGEIIPNVWDLKYNEVKDYLIEGDVTSLYPYAMVNFEYPVGKTKTLTSDECEQLTRHIQNGNLFPLGIYEVQIIPNKFMTQPTLPRRGENGIGLNWNLQDLQGTYTSVDLNNALKDGYELFKVMRGIQWTQSRYIFKSYIEMAYKLKQRGEDEGNAVLRLFGKLINNSLYGKMLQKIMSSTVKICYDTHSTDDFLLNNFWHYHTHLSEGISVMVGEKKEAVYKKPAYLGAFILSYSRQIMRNYYIMLDPYYGTPEVKKSLEETCYYTDTDSLYLHSSQDDGRIRWSDEIGGLKNESVKTGKQLASFFLGNKTYAYLYITSKDEIRVCLHCKGISQRNMNFASFVRAADEPWFQEKIVHQNSIKTYGVAESEDFLKVKSVDTHRTFNKTSFCNRFHVCKDLTPAFMTTQTLPHGHAFDPLEWASEKQYSKMVEEQRQLFSDLYM